MKGLAFIMSLALLLGCQNSQKSSSPGENKKGRLTSIRSAELQTRLQKKGSLESVSHELLTDLINYGLEQEYTGIDEEALDSDLKTIVIVCNNKDHCESEWRAP